MYSAEWCATKSSFHFFTEWRNSANVHIDLLTDNAVPSWMICNLMQCFNNTGLHLIEDWMCGISDEQFPQEWIGRWGPIPCPPRSPDVTTLDFFLGGYIKDNVCKFWVNNFSNLKTRGDNVFSSANEQTFMNTGEELQCRLHSLRSMKFIELGLFCMFSLCCLMNFLYTWLDFVLDTRNLINVEKIDILYGNACIIFDFIWVFLSAPELFGHPNNIASL